MVLALLYASLVWAQPATEEQEDDNSIVVYGERLVEQARQEVIQDLKDLGFTRVKERNGMLVLQHVDNWRGEVQIKDGYVRHKRSPVRFEAPKGKYGWITCAVPILCLRTGGQLVSPRKLAHVKAQSTQVLEPNMVTWRHRISDLATQGKLESLPERFDALWAQGEPLVSDAVLVTPSSRRAELLAYWESRTETPWGDEIRRAIESFVRAVVQQGEHPFTQAEIDAFNASRSTVQPFRLERH